MSLFRPHIRALPDQKPRPYLSPLVPSIEEMAAGNFTNSPFVKEAVRELAREVIALKQRVAELESKEDAE